VRIGAHSEKFSVPGGGSVPTCVRPPRKTLAPRCNVPDLEVASLPHQHHVFFNPANLRNAGDTGCALERRAPVLRQSRPAAVATNAACSLKLESA